MHQNSTGSRIQNLLCVHPARTAAAILVIAYFVLKVFYKYTFVDDIFFYLRYAQNLAEGYGLVYNPGEHYETNTNFLWSVLLAFPFVASIEPIAFVKFASSLISCMLLALVYLITARLTDRFSALLTMILIATHWSFFAIGQTGFMPHLPSMLALAGVYFAMRYADSPGMKNALAVGISLSLLSITRLDAQLLFWVIISLAAWFVHRHGSGRMLHALPACVFPVLFFTGYLLCKWLYYGDILPASYYAKMGSKIPEEYDRLGRGIFYNWVYLRQYGFLAFIPVAVFFAAQRLRKTDFAAVRSSPAFPVVIACMAMVVLQFAYMLRSGGGVVEFRFHVVTAPFIFILLIKGIWHNRKVATIATIALINASVVHALAYRESGMEGVAATAVLSDEHQRHRKLERQGAMDVASLFSELLPYPPGIKVAITGGGFMPFHLRVHTIEMQGWTDTRIQEKGNHFLNIHHPLPGHQFLVSPGFLLKEGVNILFGHPNLLPRDWRQHNKLDGNFIDRFTLAGGSSKHFNLPPDMKIVEFPSNDGRVMLGLYMIRSSQLDELFRRKNLKMHDLDY